METDITFNGNQFSMRCGKCADIHNAQLDGKQADPCGCGCHNTYTGTYTHIPNTLPYPPTNPIWCSGTEPRLVIHDHGSID